MGHGSDLVRYFDERPTDDDVLDEAKVNRWIDAPLLVPTLDAGQLTYRLWGKLSVDRGPNSDRLDARDVAVLAPFALVAGGAIGAMEALGPGTRPAAAVPALLAALATEADWRADDRAMLPSVLDMILEMYLQITKADVVFFRDETRPATPRRQAAVARPADGRTPRCPEEKRARRGVQQPHPGDGGPEPIIDNQARIQARRLLTDRPAERWTAAEAHFLHSIGSEACIPIEVPRRGRAAGPARRRGGGVPGGERLPRRPRPDRGAFPPHRQPLVRVGRTARHRELAEKGIALLEAVAALPLLADSPGDDQFFAGLATLLTAHNGLGWNRAMIFSCQGAAPSPPSWSTPWAGPARAWNGGAVCNTTSPAPSGVGRPRAGAPPQPGPARPFRDGRPLSAVRPPAARGQ